MTDDRPRPAGRFPCEQAACTEPASVHIRIGDGPTHYFCHAHYREVSGLRPEVQPEHTNAPARMTDSQWQASYDSWLDKREAMGR